MTSYTPLNALARRLIVAVCLWASIFLARPGSAQSPAGPLFHVNPTRDAHHDLNDVSMTPDGRFFVMWTAESFFDPQLDPMARLLLREYPPYGEAAQPYVLFEEKEYECCFLNARLAVNNSGNVVIAIRRSYNGNFSVRRRGFPSGPRSFWVERHDGYGPIPRDVALDPEGGFVLVWTTLGQESTDIDTTTNEGVFGRRYDRSGHPLGPEFHVNTRRRGRQTLPSVAMSSDTRAFVVVWQSQEMYESSWRIYGQRFAANGERLGGEFLVTTRTEGHQARASVAMNRVGNFVVTWTEHDLETLNGTAVFAQRFDARGERLGGEIRVSENDPNTVDSFHHLASVTMDPQGNFAVSWQYWPEGAILRLYRADGTPVGKSVPVSGMDYAMVPLSAFAANGTFGTAWTALASDYIFDFYTQRFSASPGNEICMSRLNEFVCDTGRTGGAPEVRYSFGGAAGETGVLGDIDGDGRADACFYRKGVFFCDTEHNFGTAETKIRLGQTGDTPLLGDVNRDGKADPCIYRSSKFLCDTAHDGFAAEFEVAFGGPGDQPLLGDVDGDGHADPCVYRTGQFLCDTAHDGGAAEIQIPFGQAGDQPLLGDFDGDGRADPCVYRAGQFLCDTAHNGGAAEATITFGDGNGVPMLGNLDGL